jgi:fluoroacetyl-CoA thioesterase
MIEAGLTGRAEARVDGCNTADRMGSGDCPVFATPAMVALMEAAACDAVAGHLEEGQTTVGISLNIRHNYPTAVGKRVYAHSELMRMEGRRLVFRVIASDEAGEIGEGEHVRAIVNREKFLSRAAQRAQSV